MPQESKELPGLRANLDKLVYFRNTTDKQPNDTPHAFIYFITINNLSDSTISLRGRRWVLHADNGHRHIIEGEGIVGKEPTLAPGESFSYNSYHMTHSQCIATGSFHGVDSFGNHIHLRIPEIKMKIPPHTPDSPLQS